MGPDHYRSRYQIRHAWWTLRGFTDEYAWMEDPAKEDNDISASGTTFGGEPDDTGYPMPEQSRKGYIPPTETSEAALQGAGLDAPLG